MRAGIVAVVLVALMGCGQPANLDRDEAIASARTCASLLERAAGRREAAGVTEFALDGEQVDLFADPESFYRALKERRGPAVFALAAAAAEAEGRVSAEPVAALCRPDR